MDCREVEERGIVERYVTRRLPDSDLEAFEEHYFACDRCFEMVETANAVGAGFGHPTQPLAKPRPWLPVAAAAGIAAIVVGVLAYQRSQSPSELMTLGTVAPGELPVYVPASLRGGSVSAAALFDRGMEAYVRGDYEEAASRLTEAVERDSTNAVWHLYLGASLLVSEEPEEAARSLEVAADNPLLADDSNWLLARAYMQAGEAGPALAILEDLGTGDGPRAEEARTLADRIRHSSDR